MLKKLLLFNAFVLLFLFSSFNFSFSYINENVNHDSGYVSNKSTKATDVSTMEEFFSAANNNEDMNITADIDFSEATASDYLIKGYSKEINGNNHTLYNGLIELSPDPLHLFYALFDDFSGEIRNLTLDNFPFFARELEKDTLNTTTPDIENITIINTSIDGFTDTKEYAGTSDEYAYVRVGLFAEKATNYNLSGFSIVNSGFSNNSFTFYRTSGTTKLETYFGMVAGMLQNSILSNSYLIDNYFYQNEFYRYTDKTETTILSGAFELGMLSGRSIDTTLKYNFINNIDISNNVIIASYLRFGALNGYSQSLKMEENYISSINIKDNKFTITDPDGFNFAMLTGFVNTIGGANTAFSKNIISDEGVSGNTLAKTLNGSASPVEPGEYGTNASNYFEKSDKNYFVGGSGTDPKINYIDASATDVDFWKNDIQFDSSIWNLDKLVDSNLQILDDPLQSGYPVFNTINYLYNDIDTSGSNLTINFKNIASNDATSFKIKSIFGDEWNLNLNASDTINTEIPTSYFADKTPDEILNFLNQSFWFELQTSSSFDNLIFIGDLTNKIPKTFTTPSMELTSTLDPVSKEATFSTITFNGSVTNDALIMSDLANYNSFAVNSYYGSDNITLDETNTMKVPDYIENYDQYYQINIPETFNYIDQNKTLQTQNLSISGEISNVNTSPEQLVSPELILNTTYNQETKELTVTLSIEDNNSYIETPEGLENTTFKIASTFQEFAGSYEISYTLNDFTKIDNNNFSKVITLSSDVPTTSLNEYYAIEINSSLEYYTDLSGNKDIINQINITGDLTNEDSSIIIPYDPSKTFDGTIQTEFVDGKKIRVTFNNTFPYLLDYQINLVLKTDNETQKITITESTSMTAEVDVVPELASYYDSLSGSEQASFDINNYYSIDFSSDISSQITFIDTTGNYQTTVLDSWDLIETRNNNTLKLQGDLTNTTNIIQPITSIPDPETNLAFIFELVSAIFLLIILIIFLLWMIYRKRKGKNEKKSKAKANKNLDYAIETSSVEPNEYFQDYENPHPGAMYQENYELETNNEASQYYDEQEWTEQAEPLQNDQDYQQESNYQDDYDFAKNDESSQHYDEQEWTEQAEPLQNDQDYQQESTYQDDYDFAENDDRWEPTYDSSSDAEQEKTNEQILEEWI